VKVPNHSDVEIGNGRGVDGEDILSQKVHNAPKWKERLFFPLLMTTIILIGRPVIDCDGNYTNEIPDSNIATGHNFDLQNNTAPQPTIRSMVQENEKELHRVGEEGGAWTAETHLRQYGFNVDAGLLDIIEESCREIENQRQTDGSMWSQHPGIFGLWKPPTIVDCRALELGPGVGVYVDSLKKDSAKRNRQVYGIEPNSMGGTFERRNGPKQLAIDILEAPDSYELAKTICKDHLKGNSFDLVYSIEVCEHMPLDRHEDAAKFLAGLSRKGTKLIFGAAHLRQSGTGHIGNRRREEWDAILAKVGFVKDELDTLQVKERLNEYNHKLNTQVYYYQEKVLTAIK